MPSAHDVGNGDVNDGAREKRREDPSMRRRSPTNDRRSRSGRRVRTAAPHQCPRERSEVRGGSATGNFEPTIIPGFSAKAVSGSSKRTSMLGYLGEVAAGIGIGQQGELTRRSRAYAAERGFQGRIREGVDNHLRLLAEGQLGDISFLNIRRN